MDGDAEEGENKSEPPSRRICNLKHRKKSPIDPLLKWNMNMMNRGGVDINNNPRYENVDNVFNIISPNCTAYAITT